MTVDHVYYGQQVAETYWALQRGEITRDEALDRFVELARSEYSEALDRLAGT